MSRYTIEQRLEIMSDILDTMASKMNIDISKIYFDFDEELLKIKKKEEIAKEDKRIADEEYERHFGYRDREND